MLDDAADPFFRATSCARRHAARALEDAERLRRELAALTGGLAAARFHLVHYARAV